MQGLHIERFQPIIVVTDARLECDCGVLATLLVLSVKQIKEHPDVPTLVEPLCQDCWSKKVGEEYGDDDED